MGRKNHSLSAILDFVEDHLHNIFCHAPIMACPGNIVNPIWMSIRSGSAAAALARR